MLIGSILGAWLALAATTQDVRLAGPVRVQVGDAPIDVDSGHAAPLFVDFDGDGLRDLLVGQFGDGKLRIYRNVGDARAPKFVDFQWFVADGKEGTIPAS
ncbi:MAG: hypothetical protein L6Q99_09315 [Planctomycetes bacterium]|nr:hypothetical protein [Planctomycetota bacterium]